MTNREQLEAEAAELYPFDQHLAVTSIFVVDAVRRERLAYIRGRQAHLNLQYLRDQVKDYKPGGLTKEQLDEYKKPSND